MAEKRELITVKLNFMGSGYVKEWTSTWNPISVNSAYIVYYDLKAPETK